MPPYENRLCTVHATATGPSGRNRLDVRGDLVAVEHLLPVRRKDLLLGLLNRLVSRIRHAHTGKLVKQNRQFNVEVPENEVACRLCRHTTLDGLVGRFVTDWTGPDAIIKRCALKLGVPNVPGETMKLRGTVKEKDDGAGTLVLEVVGSNSWGDHVNAAITVALPTGA